MIVPGARKFWFLLVSVFVLGLVALVVMWLWNCLVPEIFHFRALTYFQALGLIVLSRLLFGRIPFRPGAREWKGRGDRSGRSNIWKEKFSEMDPEKRAEFQVRWKEKCEKKEAEKHEPG